MSLNYASRRDSRPPTFREILSILSDSLKSTCLSDPSTEEDPIVVPSACSMVPLSRSRISAPCTSLRKTWIGHATVLLQFPTEDPLRPFNVLTDPIFESSCSPFGFPARSNDAPCKVEDLPEVELLITSHNHPDHLSFGTMRKIVSRNRDTIHIGPLGIKKDYSDNGIQLPADQLIELDWWQGIDIFRTSRGYKILGRHDVPAISDEKAYRDGLERYTILDDEGLSSPVTPSLGKFGETGAVLLDVGDESGDMGKNLSEAARYKLSINKVDQDTAHLEDNSLQDDDLSISFIPAKTDTVQDRLSNLDQPAFTIFCTPAQHNSGRSFTLRDKDASLCASWVIRQPKSRINTKGTQVYFAGDTGYRTSVNGPPASFFQEIRDRVGRMTDPTVPGAAGAITSTLGLSNKFVYHLHTSGDDTLSIVNTLAGPGPYKGRKDTAPDPADVLVVHHTTWDSERGSKRTLRDLIRAGRAYRGSGRRVDDSASASSKGEEEPVFAVVHVTDAGVPIDRHTRTDNVHHRLTLELRAPSDMQDK